MNKKPKYSTGNDIRRRPTSGITRERVIEYKNPPRPTFGYTVLNGLFSTLLFMAVYLFYIILLPWDIVQFIAIFLISIVSGVLGSWIARMLTGYTERMGKNSQDFNKVWIAALLYAIVVFFGLYGSILARYVDFSAITVAEFLVYLMTKEFFEILGMLLLVKIIIFLLAEFFANWFTMG